MGPFRAVCKTEATDSSMPASCLRSPFPTTSKWDSMEETSLVRYPYIHTSIVMGSSCNLWFTLDIVCREPLDSGHQECCPRDSMWSRSPGHLSQAPGYFWGPYWTAWWEYSVHYHLWVFVFPLKNLHFILPSWHDHDFILSQLPKDVKYHAGSSTSTMGHTALSTRQWKLVSSSWLNVDFLSCAVILVFNLPGTYVIDVLFESMAIPGSPYHVKAYDTGSISVSPIPNGMVGKPSEFTSEYTWLLELILTEVTLAVHNDYMTCSWCD